MSSSRRHEEDGQPIMRKVSLNPGGIAALKPGLYSIKDAWVEVGGVRTSEVKVGAEFDILVKYVVENIGGISWSACVTVIGDGIANYEDTRPGINLEKIEETAKLDNLGKNVMPNKDLSLRVKLWINDSAYPSPRYPPQTEW